MAVIPTAVPIITRAAVNHSELQRSWALVDRAPFLFFEVQVTF